MKKRLLVGLIGVWATTVMAHSPLERTNPMNEATIVEVPSEVFLEFNGGIRLTRVTMTYADDDSVDLNLGDDAGFVSSYSISMPPMGNGVYVIDWRGLGTDGHAMNGTFRFIVE